MVDKCDLHLIGDCSEKATIYISFETGEVRKLCLKHGINHIKLMLLGVRNRTFQVKQVK